jgi:DNA primase
MPAGLHIAAHLHGMANMRIDTDQIRTATNLLEIAGRDTSLKKVAGTNGGEYAGPCPFCGGTDRFHIQPVAGRWFCRVCSDGRWNDVIGYVRQRDGVDFLQACQTLGAGAQQPSPQFRPSSFSASANARKSKIALSHPPSAAWQATGMRLVEECERTLWSPQGRTARSYLRTRGLSDDTLRLWRVGFQPGMHRWVDQDSWGLSGNRVWLPRGIVLPWMAGGILWHIKVRNPDARRSDERYRSVRGGQPYLFGADNLRRSELPVLVEGEFDTMLLHQEAAVIVTPITLGSASARPCVRAACALLPHPVILVAYDSDGSSDRQIASLGSLSRRLRPIAIPRLNGGKDLTDFVCAGGNLKEWINSEVKRLGNRP